MARYILLNDVEVDRPAYNVQVAFQGASGLPEDRFVNNWHFVAPGDIDEPTNFADIQAVLGTFYTTIQEYLSTVALGAANLQVPAHIYREDDEEPREPTTVILGINLTGQPALGLPNECAVCLSFYSERNIPRRRGRVFVGPLSTAVLDPAVAGAGDRRISAAAATEFATAADQLRDTITSVVWCTRSGTSGAVPGDPTKIGVFRQVTDGWVDNAVDIQRRRGTAASTRTSF